tara:strand:- start:295 stop:789 length:495 start_codon:yes stop_codon:yes gene_type:complete
MEALTSLNNSCYSDISQYGANGATFNVYKSLPVVSVPTIYEQLGTPHPFVQGIQTDVTPCYSESSYLPINRYCPGMNQTFPVVTATGYMSNTIERYEDEPVILYTNPNCGFAQKAEHYYRNELASGKMRLASNDPNVKATPTFRKGNMEVVGLNIDEVDRLLAS